ncbi:hypothetical protein ABMA28_005646 [Loxostege sticticalis]|uniref:Uncharacterized protein n=1 Tax=Loxostege sticticalis TaxID=481309 RepID=A0ABD0SN17_LOXSC
MTAQRKFILRPSAFVQPSIVSPTPREKFSSDFDVTPIEKVVVYKQLKMAAEDLHPITSDNINKHGDLSETQNKRNILQQRVLKNIKKMYGNLPP